MLYLKSKEAIFSAVVAFVDYIIKLFSYKDLISFTKEFEFVKLFVFLREDS